MSATTPPTTGRTPSIQTATRSAYLLLGLGLFATAVAVDGWSWWLLLWALAPDLPLLAGMDPSLEHGRLHPRAVPAYNATHRLLGPLVVLAAGTWMWSTGQTTAVLAAGLVWTAHIGLDRAAGYGLRTPEGYQRTAAVASLSPAEAARA